MKDLKQQHRLRAPTPSSRAQAREARAPPFAPSLSASGPQPSKANLLSSNSPSSIFSPFPISSKKTAFI